MMRRRSALLSIGALILGTRSAEARRLPRQLMSHSDTIANAAARVAVQARSLPHGRQAASLCSLVAVKSRTGNPLSPALVQATQDACHRTARRLSPAGNPEFRRSIDAFEQSARKLIATSGV